MASASQASLRRYIPELDGLRALAVLFVFSFHLGGGGHSANLLVRAVATVTGVGWAGVTLFFVLSGFLISGILWDGRGRGPWVRSFYVRRALRILPLYYAVLLFVFVVYTCVHAFPFAWSTIAPSLVFLQDVPGPLGASINTDGFLPLFHFWSLAVEEQFYLLWPLLLMRQRNQRAALWLCSAAMAMGFGVQWLSVKYSFFGQLPIVFPRTADLAAGAWVAIAYRSSLRPHLRLWATVLMLPCFLGCVALLVSHSPYRPNLLSAATVPFCACLLVLAMEWLPLRSLLRLKGLRWIGALSYGIYVYHVLLSHLFTNISRRLAGGDGTMRFFLLRAIVFSVGTLTVAATSKRLLEDPFIRLKDRLAGSPVPSLEEPVS